MICPTMLRNGASSETDPGNPKELERSDKTGRRNLKKWKEGRRNIPILHSILHSIHERHVPLRPISLSIPSSFSFPFLSLFFWASAVPCSGGHSQHQEQVEHPLFSLQRGGGGCSHLANRNSFYVIRTCPRSGKNLLDCAYLYKNLVVLSLQIKIE